VLYFHSRSETSVFQGSDVPAGADLLTDKQARVLAGDVVGQMVTLDQDLGRQSFGLLPGPPA